MSGEADRRGLPRAPATTNSSKDQIFDDSLVSKALVRAKGYRDGFPSARAHEQAD